MKKYLLMVTSATLVLNASALMAGSITDNYAKGDVLTAAKLDSIKSAVNDNDSASRFYGDGSAGPLTISANTDWNVTSPAADNFNFTNVVIDAGMTLTVPAGTVIRCTGTFTNNGTIIVSDAGNRAKYGIGLGKSDAARPAGDGRTGTANTFRAGGAGGKGINRAVAASSFNHFTFGGGAGAGLTVVDGVASGGGLVKIYCQGSIVNTDNIQANGKNGLASGGGGGGIIILASSTSIDNTGAISAKGGKGLTAGGGAPGGGGGGIIILVSPVINTSSSTLFVDGGFSGSSSGTVSSTNSSTAGGGGGASGGNGGKGGDIDSSNNRLNASAGTDGYVIQLLANPANMMQ